MNKVQRRIDKAIGSYECALMNNTKWREVLDILDEENMPIHFAFVGDEKFGMAVQFPKGGCKGNHTLDCCAHGPFYLREIYAIKCPKFQNKMRPESGEKYRCEVRFRTVIERLINLGKLPITVSEEGFKIYGYKKS